MTKQASDDAKLAELIGLTGPTLTQDSLVHIAMTLLALMDEMGADPVRVAAAKAKMFDRLGKQRMLLEAQQRAADVAESQRVASILSSFQKDQMRAAEQYGRAS